MKKTLITGIASVCLVAASYGQGVVIFDNSTQNGGQGAVVLDTDGVPVGICDVINPNASVNFFAQLYAGIGTGVASASLVAVPSSLVNFNDWATGFTTGAGEVLTGGTTSLGQTVNPAVTISFLASGGPATIQMRAWWGDGNLYQSFDTYAAQTVSNPSARWGWSNVLNLPSTGTSDPTGALPVPLTNLQGFQLTPLVPEPGTMAFGGLGALSLLLFRRRK